ncbi:MAG: hypothetical protein ACOC6A_05525, partial [Chloroflexota bacterium]
YCGDTGQSRKYVIRRIGTTDHHPGHRKKRTETYDGPVIAALARMWQIFDYPCGQRLKVLLEEETERLLSVRPGEKGAKEDRGPARRTTSGLARQLTSLPKATEWFATLHVSRTVDTLRDGERGGVG